MPESRQQYIEQLIAAIDAGQPPEAIDSDDAEVAALMRVAAVAASIRQRQQQDSKRLSPGTRWAHLEIREHLGSGGFGDVYRAFDTALQAEVAVKFLNQRGALYFQRDEFLNEARTMATVRNPHVLAIHGAATDQGVAGYWSDYLDGARLRDALLTDAPPSAAQRTGIIDELVQAVQAIHAAELVHGDIKSINVMLQPKRGAILLDFGASGPVGRREDGRVLASPIAMAPEQHRGEAATQASDVYALGLLMIEVLGGRHPLSDAAADDLAQASEAVHRTVAQWPVPAAWRGLIAEMLNPDAAQRPNIEAVAARVSAIHKRPLQRMRRLALSAVLGLLLAITGFSVYNAYSVNQAQAQAQAINDILSDTFLKVSAYPDGQSTLLTEALGNAWDTILTSERLSSAHRQQLLIRLLGTFVELNDLDGVMTRAPALLDVPDLSEVHRLRTLRYQADVHLQRRQNAEAEAIYAATLEIHSTQAAVVDEQLAALSMWFYSLLQRRDYTHIPELLARSEALEPLGSNTLGHRARMAYNRAAYLNRLGEAEAAHAAYMDSARWYSELHHPEHYSVLTAEGQAANVHINSSDPALRAQGMQQLAAVIERMDRVSGPDHGNTLALKINLAIAHNQNGQSEQALAMYAELQPLMYKNYGQFGQYTLQSFERNYAGALIGAGRDAEAMDKLSAIIEAYRTHHPEDWVNRFKAQFDRIVHNYNQGRLQAAAAEAGDVWQECQVHFPADDRVCQEAHWQVLKGAHLLGPSPDTAQDLHNLLAHQRDLWGEDDPQVQALERNLSEVLSPQ